MSIIGRTLVSAFLVLAAIRADGARCERWESRPHVTIRVATEVYVVSTGDEVCVDRWSGDSRVFERWFSERLALPGAIVSTQFRSSRDIELLTTDGSTRYTLSALHVGVAPQDTVLRRLWTLDLDDVTSAAHPLGSASWFLPTSSGGLVVQAGRIECSVKSAYGLGLPGASASTRGFTTVTAGHSLWRYRPGCAQPADAGTKRLSISIGGVAAVTNGWVVVGRREGRSALYSLDRDLHVVGKVDVGPDSVDVELRGTSDGAVATLPSSGVAYSYGREGIRRLVVPKGFTACLSWSQEPLLFSDGATVQAPASAAAATLTDVREVTIAGVTFVPTVRDFRGQVILVAALALLVGGVVGFYRRRPAF
jgi:hypothetical protein